MIEKAVEFFFQNLFISYWGAFLFFVFGLIMIKITNKDQNSTIRQKIMGLSSGFGAIVLSILIFIFKFLGKI